MDATRQRRMQDPCRQTWYARWRCLRFARRLGFGTPPQPAALSARLPSTPTVGTRAA
jgi:hypothetical protein